MFNIIAHQFTALLTVRLGWRSQRAAARTLAILDLALPWPTCNRTSPTTTTNDRDEKIKCSVSK